MKPLYILNKNCGDGSFYPRFTFDERVLDYLEQNFSEEYWDSDGFHFEILKIPENCTKESLGISHLLTLEDFE